MRANPVTPPKQLFVRLRLNQPGRAAEVSPARASRGRSACTLREPASRMLAG